MYMYEIRAFKSTYKSGAKGSACPVHSLAKKAQTYCCALTRTCKRSMGQPIIIALNSALGTVKAKEGLPASISDPALSV